MHASPLARTTALVLAALATQSVAAADSLTTAREGRARAHIAQFAGLTHHGRADTYAARDSLVDADGAEHVRFERQYRGLRVLGGDLVVHSHGSGTFLGASQTLREAIQVGVKPTVSAAKAQKLALAHQAGDSGGQVPELIVYARGERPALAWDARVFGQRADQTPYELHVIVDAHSGAVLESWDDVHDAAAAGTGKGLFSGTVALTTDLVGSSYVLRDPSRGNTYTTNMANKTSGNGTVFSDADNVWGNFTTSDAATIGVDAQYGTAMTWDYYKNVHGRTGIANNGVGAFNRVHYGRKYNNAFWSDSCFCMTYGDGDGTTFNPFDSLDVAGHEMTHGVTSRTANLTYSGESGGLNEATSDIFGTLVEFYAANANDPGDYRIGEKLYKTGGKALRYMYSPNTDGASADCWYSGLGALDVHYSSGVANHFFYLLAEGSQPAGGPASPTCVAGNTKKATGSAVLGGIGQTKAGAIWYRALTVYMTSSTNYAAARVATVKAATDLYGAGSAEAAAVAAAWSAVLVN